MAASSERARQLPRHVIISSADIAAWPRARLLGAPTHGVHMFNFGCIWLCRQRDVALEFNVEYSLYELSAIASRPEGPKCTSLRSRSEPRERCWVGAERSGARVKSAPVVAEAAGAQAWVSIGSPGVKLIRRMKEPAQ